MTTKTDILQIKLTTDGDGKVKASIAGISKKLGSISEESGKAAQKSFTLAKAVASVAAGFALYKTGQIITGLVNVNKQFDSLEASLTTVTGSEKAAEKAFSGIQEFAATTPFQLDEVTSAFIKLKALGLDPSDAALRSYGNTASAMGKDLNQMVEAIADAVTGEFERLKEFGIKAKVQGDQVSLRFRGVTTTIGNNAREIENYLRRIGDVEFAGGMERQMDTIGGAFSNLEDSTSRFARAIGENSGFNDALKSATGLLTDMLNAATNAFSPDVIQGDWLDNMTSKIDALSNRLVEAEAELARERSDRSTLSDIFGITTFEGRVTAAQAKIEGIKTLIIALSTQTNELAKMPGPDTAPLGNEDVAAQPAGGKFDTSALADAEKITRSLYTAQQTLSDELLRLNGIWQAGNLSVDVYGQAIRRAKQEFDDATGAGKEFIALMAQGEQVTRANMTPLEVYSNEIMRLNGLWQAGAIGSETYGLAVGAAQDQFIRQTQSQADVWVDVWTTAANGFASGVGNAVADAIFEQKNLADTMRAVLRGVLRQVIATLVQIGVKKLILAALDTTALATQTAAVVASGVTIATAMAPAAAATSLATAGGNAVPAAAGVASVYALTESLALAGVAHSGLDYVPREGTYLLKQGEMVLDPGTSDAVRKSAQNGGGDRPVVISMPITNNAIDARGIVGLIRGQRGLIGSIAVAAVNEALNSSGRRSLT